MTATLLRLLSHDRGRLRHQTVDRLSQVEGRTSAFLLYMSDNLYQVVPKRFFASDSDLRAFRELVGKRIARRAP